MIPEAFKDGIIDYFGYKINCYEINYPCNNTYSPGALKSHFPNQIIVSNKFGIDYHTNRSNEPIDVAFDYSYKECLNSIYYEMHNVQYNAYYIYIYFKKTINMLML